MLKQQSTNPFQRGAMHFEDFNYDLYNKFILIDPNKGTEESFSLDEDEEYDIKSESKSEMVGFAMPKG